MERITKRKLLIIFIPITIAVIIVASTIAFAATDEKDSPHGCVLSIYEENVALYVDGVVTEVYPEIVLDTLPKQDVDQLKFGIAFDNIEDARLAIQDYDG